MVLGGLALAALPIFTFSTRVLSGEWMRTGADTARSLLLTVGVLLMLGGVYLTISNRSALRPVPVRISRRREG
jgi:hypothetical protein